MLCIRYVYEDVQSIFKNTSMCESRENVILSDANKTSTIDILESKMSVKNNQYSV